MKIALIQQRATASKEKNILKGLKAIDQAARKGAELIVFPELSFLPFFPQTPGDPRALELAETIPGPTTEIFSRVAKELGLVIVINLYERKGKNVYDSSPVIDADGHIVGLGRMVHIMEGPGFHEKNIIALAIKVDWFSPPRLGE